MTSIDHNDCVYLVLGYFFAKCLWMIFIETTSYIRRLLFRKEEKMERLEKMIQILAKKLHKKNHRHCTCDKTGTYTSNTGNNNTMPFDWNVVIPYIMKWMATVPEEQDKENTTQQDDRKEARQGRHSTEGRDDIQDGADRAENSQESSKQRKGKESMHHKEYIKNNRQTKRPREDDYEMEDEDPEENEASEEENPIEFDKK